MTTQRSLQVDAHHHLWAASRGDYGWLGHGEVGQGPLRRHASPGDFEPLLRGSGIDCTVLVQAAPTTHETEYLLGLADATEWIAKVVGWVDFEDVTHRWHLERFAAHPKFAGVRPMIQDIVDIEWMHREDVQWAFRAIIELDLSFDALGYPQHMPSFARLLQRYPGMRAVIDHCLKPRIGRGGFDDWARGMEEIAVRTSAYCKLSGLVTEAPAGWDQESLEPYVTHVLQAFGPERVMWGSDWPVLELNGTFEAWRDAACQLIGSGPVAELVLGETASSFYGIDARDF